MVTFTLVWPNLAAKQQAAARACPEAETSEGREAEPAE